MKYGTMSQIFKGEKILMVQKTKREGDPNSGFYTLPGGKLKESEKGGNPEGRLESAIRETREETGLIMVNPLLRGVILFDNEGRDFPNWPNPDNFLVYIYSSFEQQENLKKRTSEGRPVWVCKSEIPNLPQNPGDKMMYKWLKIPNFFAGVIKHKGNELDKEHTFVDYYNIL